jgi:general bacterial porin, GBP family
MRKSLLAVSLALAFPSAFAQSRNPVPTESIATGATRVELYGIADIGFERLDVGSVNANRISSGIAAGSRLGFRGSEDLGGGWRGVFVLEQRLEIDSGRNSNNSPLFYCGTTPSCPGVVLTSPLPPAVAPTVLAGLSNLNSQLLQAVTTVNGVGALFDRQAFAGLITPFGAFLLGRQYTPGYEVMNRFTSFADATAGQIGQGYSALAIRANNAIQWRADLGGAVASLMYGFGGTDGSRNERVLDPTKGDDFYGINLQYHAQSFSVGVGYNRNQVVTFSAPTRSQKGLETLNVGATATLGSFKLFGTYMTRKNENPIIRPEDLQGLIISTGGNQNAILAQIGALQINPWDVDLTRGVVGPSDGTIYHLGFQWRVGAGTVHGAFNRAKDEARSVWATSDATVDHLGLAYFHSLSHRTQLYSVYALAKNKGSARMALGSAGYAGGFVTAQREDSSAVQFGIRHSF